MPVGIVTVIGDPERTASVTGENPGIAGVPVVIE